MNIIYSEKQIEGLNGIYANPSLFNGDTENCTAVYTNDNEIKEAYVKKGVEVLEIPKVKQKKSILDSKE